MRILSQNGSVDINYDLGNLSIAYGSGGNREFYSIYFHSCSCVEGAKMAEYSTEEKARKAMDMLHGAYCGEIYMKCGDYEISDIDLSQELEKKIREEMSKAKFLTTVPNPMIECKIFQFPQDNEIEV